MALNRRLTIQQAGFTTDGDGEEATGTADDLVTDADPEFFDQTYLVDKSDLPLEVNAGIPIPRPWQGIPRMAMVFNFNMVWDSDAEKWVRDTGNRTRGGIPDLDHRFIQRSSDTSDIFLEPDEHVTIENKTSGNLNVFLPESPRDLTLNGVAVVAESNNNADVFRQGSDLITDNSTSERIFLPGDRVWYYDEFAAAWWVLR